jgi:uncharacterized protein involved in response to NO
MTGFDRQAFFSLGFRPLYLAGCLWACIAIGIWVYAPQLASQPLAGVAWHAHEMLWGFIATIAMGFLLTASATWTGLNPAKGHYLAGLCALWLVARIAYLVAGNTGFWIAVVCDFSFFALCAIALLRVVAQSRNRRNYGIPLLALGLGASHAFYATAALTRSYEDLMRQFNVGLICMAILALLIARRVIPFFTMRAIPGTELPMCTRSGHIQLFCATVALIGTATGHQTFAAIFLGLTGLVSVWQLWHWQTRQVYRRPLLWVLHLGYAIMALGLILAAAQMLGLTQGSFARMAAPAHVLGMGGFSLLIIGMVSRTSLGHLGRPMELDRSMLYSYFAMIAAIVLRIAALWPSSLYLSLLHASAFFWILSLGLYLWRFTPWLVRPRPDTSSLHAG